MVSIINPIYRDENATELNKRVEDLLHRCQIEHEAINDCFMDLALDNDERREKTFNEISKNPEQCHLMITYMAKLNGLSYVISELKNIIYSGYTETPLNEEKESRMNKKEMSVWLGDNVKPLILKRVKRQNAIALELDVPANTICYRIKAVHGENMSWGNYVEYVLGGTF